MTRDAAIGIIANPLAGKDIRRLVAHAMPVSDHEKVSIVRRALLGAIEAGVERIIMAPDGRRLAQRAIDGLGQRDATVGVTAVGDMVEFLDMPVTATGADTEMAASLMRDRVGAVVVLGGDGTNRDVARGWLEAPVVPVSTGTNNVFPQVFEGSTAGTAAGLVASGAVSLDQASPRPALVMHCEIDGQPPDLALVDIGVIDGAFTGARAVWNADSVTQMLVAIAEPWAMGLSALAGLVAPTSRDGDRAVHLVLNDESNRRLRAPIAPGVYAEVGIDRVAVVELDTPVTVWGPAVLALDGERTRPLAPRRKATITLRRNGPRVIDVARTFAAAVRRGHFVRHDQQRAAAELSTPTI